MKRQMGLDCIELIMRKIDSKSKMTREEYYLALMELHNKYPMPGHNPPLTSYQIENYNKIKVVHRLKQKSPKHQDPEFDIVYEDYLQPMNFLEAAEIYRQSMDKRDRKCLPLSAWKKREWPRTKLRDLKPELFGEETELFEKKRQAVKERLPYKDD